MSAKIENSSVKEYIDKVLLNNEMSLSELVKECLKRNFTVSKGTLATYAKELKALHSVSDSNDFDKDMEKIINSNIDYKERNKERKRLIDEMYNDAIKHAYKVTKTCTNKGKMLPLNLYKSVKELQGLVKGQNELLK